MRQHSRTRRRLGCIAAAATTLVAAAVLAAPAAHASSSATGAVGGVQNPIEAGAMLHLLIDASEAGQGLAVAEASIDGNTATVPLGGPSCLADPASGCPESVTEAPLAIDVGGEGTHELRVSVTDAAGNTTTLLEQEIEVRGATPKSSRATVTIGVGGGGTSQALGSTLSYSSSKPACPSPKLSMRLASKPLRHGADHMPVLRVGHRYRYKGALSCLRSGKRVSAANGTLLHVIYRIAPDKLKTRKLSVRKGKLSIVLRPARRTRSFLFRYRPAAGESTQVKLRAKVVRPDWCSLAHENCGELQLGLRAKAASALVGGEVPSTLSLSLGQPSGFVRTGAAGARAHEALYTASVKVALTATETPVSLSLADGEAIAGAAEGHLVDGGQILSPALEAAVGREGPYMPLAGSVAPALKQWSQPLAKKDATIRLREAFSGRASGLARYHKTLLATVGVAGP